MPSFGARHGDVLQAGTPSPGHPRAAQRMLLSCPCGPNAQLPVRMTVATSSAPTQAPALSILALPEGAGGLQGKAGC